MMADEHEGHGHKIFGLPAPAVYIGGGILLLFIVLHGSAAPVASGVALPATAAADLSQQQGAVLQLQQAQQSEALLNQAAIDKLNQQQLATNLSEQQQAFSFGLNQQAATNLLQQQVTQQQINAQSIANSVTTPVFMAFPLSP